jgi:hypothetical protein
MVPKEDVLQEEQKEKSKIRHSIHPSGQASHVLVSAFS